MITVNGEKLQYTGNINLKQLLLQLGYSLELIAVECNGSIITKKQYDDTILKDGDCLEVVSFVGGG